MEGHAFAGSGIFVCKYFPLALFDTLDDIIKR